jgi:hypothetical protein
LKLVENMILDGERLALSQGGAGGIASGGVDPEDHAFVGGPGGFPLKSLWPFDPPPVGGAEKWFGIGWDESGVLVEGSDDFTG